ncbi:MAG TPA: radical SAM protein [Anaerolineaceae bacterium]|nr:radical SAM protein [Anaerolineaceae bacterium]
MRTQPDSFPARVYLEPTNACNLTCRTCVRNVWQEAPGWMRMATFERVLAGIRMLAPRPLVFFGGFGEPLAHPRIVEMVKAVRQAGAPVELITNGVLLFPRKAAGLAQAGLNRLWISLDGAAPESYADLRLGAALPQVIENLRYLRTRAMAGDFAELPLGIAFVAMRRNLSDLPEVIRLGRELGADRFSISNLLPHTPAMQPEILYRRSLYRSQPAPLIAVTGVDLPPVDQDDEAVADVRAHWGDVDEPGEPAPDARTKPACPFLEKGSLSVRWDGEVAPCLPLLHGHSAYLDDRLRRSVEVSFGNVNRLALPEIWRSAPYRSFRARLADFDFSPCAGCNTCELADANLEDCFGNTHPTCGGCLWAQGLIRCP